jgi:hypothetical protein
MRNLKGVVEPADRADAAHAWSSAIEAIGPVLRWGRSALEFACCGSVVEGLVGTSR